MDRPKLDDIITFVNGILHPAGYDCLEAEWSSGEKILRLYVDLLGAGGINIDGCAAASRLLAEHPECDELVPGAFNLEVSSPGVERPLRLRRHFERALGETIQVKLRDKVQDRKNGKGKLLKVTVPETGAATEAPAAVDAESQDNALITLETEQGVWSFPLTSLQRASLVYDWGDT